MTGDSASPSAHRVTDREAGVALGLGIVILALAYGWFFLSGARFFIVKTMVMPIFVFYGVLLRNRVGFLTDWLPLLAGTVLFDAIRGTIYVAIEQGYLRVFSTYVIAMERAIFGTPALPLEAQAWRHPALDALAVALHASHFAFFLLFGLVVWHARRPAFGEYRRALLLVMAIGLVGYAAVPTVPPWLAFERYQLLPSIEHIVLSVYTNAATDLYGAFDTNPVAAMPSLHAAFPAACAIVGARAFGSLVGAGIAVYATGAILAAVYLGEHYAVDVVAGMAVAVLSAWVGRRPLLPSFSFRQALATSGGLLALTYALLAIGRR